MNQVFQTNDLMTMLVEHLDWGTLIYFSQIASAYRKLVLREIHIRIRIFLSNFVPLIFQKDFWSQLEQTSGAIFGGIVRSIMMAGNDTFYKSSPPQMDLIVPTTHFGDDCVKIWNTFLSAIGYTIVSSPALCDPFEDCTRLVNYYKRPVSTSIPSVLVTKRFSE
jgi:hypothetical protein